MAIFKKICIIDDDEIFLVVSKLIIKSEFFAEEILEFSDGKFAYKYFKENIDSIDLPEVIILDINMSLMDGWEFLDALQELGLADKLNIFISSSSIDPIDLEKAEKNPHIISFIDKPLTTEKLETIRAKANIV
jgi:CheY-like chemotaxis protein